MYFLTLSHFEVFSELSSGCISIDIDPTVAFLRSIGISVRMGPTHHYRVITNYVIGFAGPMRCLNTLNSIKNNQNIACDNGAYSLITEMHSYFIASNVQTIRHTLA